MGKVPQRIVSLQPSVTVILHELGCLPTLVGCTKYCAEICPEVTDRKIAIVADSWTAQAQQIATLRPDLVIASVPYQEKSIAETGIGLAGGAEAVLAVGEVMEKRRKAQTAAIQTGWVSPVAWAEGPWLCRRACSARDRE